MLRQNCPLFWYSAIFRFPLKNPHHLGWFTPIGLGVRGPRCSRASEVRGLCLLCLGVRETAKMRGGREHRGFCYKVTGSKASVFALFLGTKKPRTPGPRCTYLYSNLANSSLASCGFYVEKWGVVWTIFWLRSVHITSQVASSQVAVFASPRPRYRKLRGLSVYLSQIFSLITKYKTLKIYLGDCRMHD